MDGVLLIDKPKGMTSRDVVNHIMRNFKIKKCGHCGTLDPFATGLLLVTCGKATKISSFLEGQNKSYIAKLYLGEKKDTLDCLGNTVDKAEVPYFNEDRINDVFSALIGEIEQYPPIYSAIKVNGKPLYKYARNGESVEIKPRNVTIFELKLVSFKQNEIVFYVKCSKGTYVRTLGEQISERLGTFGHLTELRRISIGNFDVTNAKSINDITSNNLLSISQSLSDIKQIVISDIQTQIDIKNGKPILNDFDNEIVYFKTEEDEPLAIYRREDKSIYKCVRGLF